MPPLWQYLGPLLKHRAGSANLGAWVARIGRRVGVGTGARPGALVGAVFGLFFRYSDLLVAYHGRARTLRQRLLGRRRPDRRASRLRERLSGGTLPFGFIARVAPARRGGLRWMC
jgi:hypothetical protein